MKFLTIDHLVNEEIKTVTVNVDKIISLDHDKKYLQLDASVKIEGFWLTDDSYYEVKAFMINHR